MTSELYKSYMRDYRTGEIPTARELFIKRIYMWKYLEREKCECCGVGNVYARIFQEPFKPWTWREADPVLLCQWCFEAGR